MRKETDLSGVKAIAKALLMTSVNKTPYTASTLLPASCAPLAKLAASVSELPPLRGLEEIIKTFLFIEKSPFYILQFFRISDILIISPKPDFRSSVF